MELEKIIEKTLKNGGITIDSNFKEINKKTGYVVSDYGMEKTYFKNELEALKKDIMLYKEIAKKNDAFIGLWIDNDIIFLDISKVYDNKKEALKIAKKNKQLAIYDIKNDKSIYIKKYNYILYQKTSNNDLINIKEFYSNDEIEKEYNLKNIYQYTYNNIDSLYNLDGTFKSDIHFIKDKYIIVKESI